MLQFDICTEDLKSIGSRFILLRVAAYLGFFWTLHLSCVSGLLWRGVGNPVTLMCIGSMYLEIEGWGKKWVRMTSSRDFRIQMFLRERGIPAQLNNLTLKIESALTSY